MKTPDTTEMMPSEVDSENFSDPTRADQHHELANDLGELIDEAREYLLNAGFNTKTELIEAMRLDHIRATGDYYKWTAKLPLVREAVTALDKDVVVMSEAVDGLIRHLSEIKPVLVIVDPAVSFGVGESRVNDSEQGLIEAARAIRNSVGCCIRFIHHTGKQNAREVAVDQYAGRGGSALRKPGMPSYALAKIHLRTDPSLREAYDQSVQDRAAFLAEELIELADEPIPENLDPASRSAWVQNKRVRLDTRKWIASRVFRQVYGDRVDMSVNDSQISIVQALEAANTRVMLINNDAD